MAECEEAIERRARRGFRRLPGGTVEQAGVQRRGEIEYVVADRHSAAGPFAWTSEHAVRQVLDGEVGVTVGRGDPAAPRG